MVKEIEPKKCEYCKNYIPIPRDRFGRCYYKKRKYCNKVCSGHITGKIGGKIGGRVRAENMKREKSGFYNPEIRKMGGLATSRKYGGWSFVNKKTRIKMNKKSIETNKNNKNGFFNSETQKLYHTKAHKINKKNGTGVWDSKVREKGNRLGGLATQKVLRKNIRNLKYNNQYYDSIPEAGVSISLQKQFNYIPLEGITLHKKIGFFEYDFLVENLKLFIEFHPFELRYSYEDYYNFRRKNLDLNGHKDYELIIIK